MCIDIKFRARKSLSIYNTLLAISGISVLSYTTETEAMVGRSQLQRLITGSARSLTTTSRTPVTPTPPGPAMSKVGLVRGNDGSTLSVRVYDAGNGNFKVTRQRLRLPSGGETENPGVSSVSFTNLRGEKVYYSDPVTTRVKLLFPNSMLVKEQYLDGNGQVRNYIGIKGAGYVEEPKSASPTTSIKTTSPKTGTSAKSKKASPSTRKSRLPRPGGLATIIEED